MGKNKHAHAPPPATIPGLLAQATVALLAKHILFVSIFGNFGGKTILH
ncbi:hypothetical protein [Pontibacter qinzhouensis]|nr:hypothetical protein [Pontibacter qinzhouensis]